MKTRIFTLLFALVAIFFTANAQIKIDEITFPDENFRNLVIRKYSKYVTNKVTGEGYYAVDQSVEYLGVSNSGVKNLKGIEYFTVLKQLTCNNNPLTSLDVSNNTALTDLECYSNQLTSLDVSKNTKLESLGCGNNQLTSLDVSKNTKLESLGCGNNQLTSLDVSKNTALEGLLCDDNPLTSLNVSGCTALATLRCRNTPLTSLNVSGCAALTELYCRNNQLTSLDVSGCTALTKLECESNQLTSLNVSGCIALTHLDCTYNQLTSLNVSGCTALTGLDCYDNQLTSLDVSKNTALTGLSCWDNQLTSLDVSKNTALRGLYCWNNRLVSLDVSKCDSLRVLRCWYNQLSSLNASGCSELYWLECSNNQLTSLNVSGCTALIYLYCGNNQLTSLEVSGYTALTRLYCNNNQLTSLNVLGCAALLDLNCSVNQLTSLDVSGCDTLYTLSCYNNRIKSKAMENLVKSLRIMDNLANNRFVPVSKDINDKNICWREHVTIAKEKGWDVLGSYDLEGGPWYSYDGPDPIFLTDIYFFDDSFRKALSGILNVSEGDEITGEIIENTTKLNVPNRGIEHFFGIGNFTELKTFYCYANRIKGEAMNYLVAALPSVDLGALYIIDTKDESEKNICRKRHVAIAKEKGWTVYDYHGGKPIEYEGSDPEDVILNNQNFPDANFRNALSDMFGVNEGEVITEDEIDYCYYMDVREREISDLTGIEHFKELEWLDCSANRLTSLDVSGCTALETLLCSHNYLTSLDVSKNTALEYLSCNNNQLTSLNVSGCTLLTELRCNNNLLTTLNVSGCTALGRLSCYSNKVKGEAMNILVNNLPANWAQKTFIVINTKDKNEGNVITKKQVAVADEKFWWAFDWNYNGDEDYDWHDDILDYKGSDDVLLLDDDNFPDDNFRNAIAKELGLSEGSEINEGLIVATTKLDVSDGKITELSGIEYFTALTTIYCQINQISDKAMTSLIGALPDLSGNEAKGLMLTEETNPRKGALYALDFTDENEQNVCTAEHIAAANAKGWTVYCKTSGGWQEYNGEIPTGINTVDSGELTDDSWYSIDGKKLSGEPRKKGIYIRNGRKVVK